MSALGHAAPSAATGRSGFRPTVLVVDDDREVSSALKDLLIECGFNVVLARDGAVALELLHGGLRPIAILLDLTMPNMDGWDFRYHQLQDPALGHIPVAVVTAAGFSRETVETQFGEVELLRKPVDPAALLGVLARFRARLLGR
jgi:CheY-like chemotaxis protein